MIFKGLRHRRNRRVGVALLALLFQVEFSFPGNLAGKHLWRESQMAPKFGKMTRLRVDFGSRAAGKVAGALFKPLLCFTSSFKQGLLLSSMQEFSKKKSGPSKGVRREFSSARIHGSPRP